MISHGNTSRSNEPWNRELCFQYSCTSSPLSQVHLIIHTIRNLVPSVYRNTRQILRVSERSERVPEFRRSIELVLRSRVKAASVGMTVKSSNIVRQGLSILTATMLELYLFAYSSFAIKILGTVQSSGIVLNSPSKKANEHNLGRACRYL